MQNSKDIASPIIGFDTDLVEFLQNANIGEGTGQSAFVYNNAGEAVHWIDFANSWDFKFKKCKSKF